MTYKNDGYKEVTVRRKVNERCICDVCGRNIDAMLDEMSSHGESKSDYVRLGYDHVHESWGEVIDGSIDEYHICGPCFRAKVLPLMEELHNG